MSENEIMIYEDKDGITKVNVKFIDEDIWLTQNQLAEIYKTTQQNISQHINCIYSDRELEINSTNKKFLLVQWVQELDNQIILNRRKILEGKEKYHMKNQ